MIDPIADSIADNWQQAGTIAQQTFADLANKMKDRADEDRDSMRVHNGMTLDEFLATQ